jgi:Na+/proline symporter
MTTIEAMVFWGFLLVYGVVMYALSPRSRTAESFYRGADDQGNPVGQWSLTASLFISWIFAKSVTNAANLGAAYGVVGGLAYASYWLSIPVAGYIIYLIRTQTGARSLQDFLTSRFGRLAAHRSHVVHPVYPRLQSQRWPALLDFHRCDSGGGVRVLRGRGAVPDPAGQRSRRAAWQR